MEEDPNDVIVLCAIEQGTRKADKIRKKTKIDSQEIDITLQRLQDNGFITMVEKKGFFSPKKELRLTEKVAKELDERRFELQQKWDQMTEVWKSGDKEKLQQSIDANRPSFPAMAFMGIIDMMMFSSMISFMGLAMSSFMPDLSMHDSVPVDTGNVDGSNIGHDMGGGYFGHSDFGHDFGGFDVNF